MLSVTGMSQPCYGSLKCVPGVSLVWPGNILSSWIFLSHMRWFFSTHVLRSGWLRMNRKIWLKRFKDAESFWLISYRYRCVQVSVQVSGNVGLTPVSRTAGKSRQLHVKQENDKTDWSFRKDLDLCVELQLLRSNLKLLTCSNYNSASIIQVKNVHLLYRWRTENWWPFITQVKYVHVLYRWRTFIKAFIKVMTIYYTGK